VTSGNRARVWFALFVLAVFCLGGAAGLILGRRMERADRFDRPDGRPAFGRGGPRGPGPGGPPPQVLLERLSRDLDLTTDQRTQLDVVLRASRDRVEQFQRDVRGRFDEEQRSLHEEIRKILTPDQESRFERIIQEGRRGRGPGRGRGGPER
jgi:hypothetical protein